MRLYSDESQALEDVLRLSEGMTYKSALAHLPLGGGKACIIADPKISVGREALFKKFGECLNYLAGRYITAEDMGTSVSDMMWIKYQTKFVVGTDPAKGGAGDPSPWTARGVFLGAKAAAERMFPSAPSLHGKRVALQGVGHVGMHLLRLLVEEGASVTVCDTNEDSLREAASKYGASVASTDAIYDVACDIFSPCAIGQTINPHTVARLSAKAIVGAANNQLSDSAVYEDLQKREILYCPDFVVNSGGVICVGAELASGGPDTAWIKEKVELIYNTTCQVLDQSKARGRFTEEVAIELAKERIAAAKRC
jgi:leucine dehydrogenase